MNKNSSVKRLRAEEYDSPGAFSSRKMNKCARLFCRLHRRKLKKKTMQRETKNYIQQKLQSAAQNGHVFVVGNKGHKGVQGLGVVADETKCSAACAGGPLSLFVVALDSEFGALHHLVPRVKGVDVEAFQHGLAVRCRVTETGESGAEILRRMPSNIAHGRQRVISLALSLCPT